MLKLLANAFLVILQAFSLWRSERDRQAGVDSVKAERSSRAATSYERERNATEAAADAGHSGMLDLNDRMRDRSGRN